jgi:hypothetical protein
MIVGNRGLKRTSSSKGEKKHTFGRNFTQRSFMKFTE